jgi:hypothetical protein
MVKESRQKEWGQSTLYHTFRERLARKPCTMRVWKAIKQLAVPRKSFASAQARVLASEGDVPHLPHGAMWVSK